MSTGNFVIGLSTAHDGGRVYHVECAATLHAHLPDTYVWDGPQPYQPGEFCHYCGGALH